MANTASKATRKLKKRIVLFLAFLFPVLLWLSFEILLRTPWSAQQAEGLLSGLLRVPVHIDSLDFDFFPKRKLQVYGVVLGNEKLRLDAPEVVLEADLSALLQRKIHLTTIESVRPITLFVPQSPQEIRNAWQDFPIAKPKAATPDKKQKSSHWQASIDTLSLPVITLLRDEKRYFRGKFTAHDLISDTITLQLFTQLVGVDDDAHMQADLTLNLPDGQPPQLQGRVTAQNMDVEKLLSKPGMPHTRIDLQVDLKGPVPENLAANIQGELRTAEEELLNGTLSAKAWLRNGDFLLNDLTLQGDGVDVQLDLSLPYKGTPVFHILEATVQNQVLESLLAALSQDSFQLSASSQGQLSIQNLLLGKKEDEQLRLVSGEMQFNDIDLSLPAVQQHFPKLQGRVYVEENTFQIERLSTQSIELAGSIRPDFTTPSAALNLHGTLALQSQWLSPWVGAALLSQLSGTLTLQQCSLSLSPDHSLLESLEIVAQLADGAVTLHPKNKSGPIPLQSLQGEFSLKGTTLQIHRFQTPDLNVKGALSYLPEGKHVDVQLQGTGSLPGPAPALFERYAYLENVHGMCTLDNLEARYTIGSGWTKTPVVRASLKEGAARSIHRAYTDQITEITAQFEQDENTLQLSASALAERLGPLELSAVYKPAAGNIDATINADLGQAIPTFLPEGPARQYGNALLLNYGPSVLDLAVTLPNADTPSLLALNLSRRGEPKLNLNSEIEFTAKPSPRIHSLHGQATVSLTPLNPLLPSHLDMQGDAHCTVQGLDENGDLLINVDLSQTTLQAGEHLQKRSGDAAHIQLSLQTTPEITPRQVSVEILGESIVATLEDGGVQIPDINLNFTSLSRLLPDEGNASGTLRGNLNLSPFKLNLELDHIALALTPKLALDDIHGALQYDEGYWRCERLYLHGADSDCTVTAHQEKDLWRGALKGKKLNLNALAAMYAALQAFSFQSSAEAQDKPASEGANFPKFNGVFTCDLGELYYNQGLWRDLHAETTFAPTGIDIADVGLSIGEGKLTGDVHITSLDEANASQVSINAFAERVDIKTLDAFLSASPKKIYGIADAQSQLHFVLRPETPWQNTLTGTFTFSAQDGSYGKMGFITKLLSVLKTTEIIRLRLPALHDTGLSYDASYANLILDEGEITVEDFGLDSKAYAMSGKGSVSLPADTLDLQINANLLQSVTGIVGGVPVVGKTVDLLAKPANLVITLKGATEDPDIEVRTGAAPAKEIRKGVEETRKGFREIRKRLGL